MPGTSTTRWGASLLLLLAIASCQTLTPGTATPESQINANSELSQTTPGTVSGSVAAPVIAAGAGNIIAVGAGNIIAVGAGNIIAVGAGNYRTLGTSPGDFDELPVKGATVLLRDAETLQLLPGAQATTDAQGHFSIANLPAGLNYVVEIVGASQDGAKAFHLAGLAQALSSGSSGVTINEESTLEAAGLHRMSLQSGEIADRLYVMTPAHVQTLQTAIATALGHASDANRRLAAASLGLSLTAGHVDVPTTMAEAEIDQSGGALDTIASSDATLRQAETAMKSVMGTTLSASEAALVQRFKNRNRSAPIFVAPSSPPAPAASPAPVTAASASPSTSASPSPTPTPQVTYGATVASKAAGATITGSAGLDTQTSAFTLPFAAFDAQSTTGMPSANNPLTALSVVWGRSLFAQPATIGRITIGSWNYQSTQSASGAVTAPPHIQMGLIEDDANGTVETLYDSVSQGAPAVNAPITYTLTQPQMAKGVFVWAEPSNGGSVTFSDVQALPVKTP